MNSQSKPAPSSRPARLFHGTSEKRARAALVEGLVPRALLGKRGNWRHAVTSNPRAVYLTDTYPLYFAGHASKDHERWAVIEIETAALDEDLLRPDEDVIEQTGRGIDGLPASWDMKRRTLHYRKQAPHNPHWDVSLAAMGTCAYYGVIPPAAFTRVAFLDWREHSTLALSCADASMTVMGFKYCGAMHRARTQWLMGDPFNRSAFLGLTLGGAEVPDSFMQTPGVSDWARRWDMIIGNRKGVEVLDVRVRDEKRKRA